MSVNADFEKVSMTAKLTAYMRQYSDIPFAQDVARYIQAEKAIQRLQQAESFNMDELLWYAPFFEARYKSIAKIIENQGFQQVLELASGLSLRGLAMTLRDPVLIYVETDLPELTEQKQALLDELILDGRFSYPKNHHFTVANALDEVQLKNATQHFQPDQPLAIVTEGLIQYLSREEIEQLAQRVCGLLKTFGGVWITPDFALRQVAQPVSETHRRFRKAIADETGRTIYQDSFETQEEMLAFFERMELSVQWFSQVEVAPPLSSLDVLTLKTLPYWERIQAKLPVWVLSLRNLN